MDEGTNRPLHSPLPWVMGEPEECPFDEESPQWRVRVESPGHNEVAIVYGYTATEARINARMMIDGVTGRVLHDERFSQGKADTGEGAAQCRIS